MAFGKKEAPKAPAIPEAPKAQYHVFVCEFEELAKVLAIKDPECKGAVYAVWPMGSAVRVVMKV